LTTEKVGEIPQLAQIIQTVGQADRDPDVVEDPYGDRLLRRDADRAALRLGDDALAQHPDEHHRLGKPRGANVLLVSAFQTKAVWNAAHYSNKKYDRLTKSFIGAIALKDQRKYARQIETLLLHDTPVIIPYFYNYLSAGTKRVKGYKPMRWARCTSATPRSAEPDCDAAGRSLARP